MSQKYQVAVIGSGPGGYVAAIRASQLGLKTVLIEKSEIGGVCLNWGCIPSKSLIHQAYQFASIGDLENLGLKVDKSGFNYEKVYQKSRNVADRLSKGVKFLIEKNKIDLIVGEAKIKDKNTLIINGKDTVGADNILIATGSRPRQIPGFEFDEETVLSSTGILSLKKLPESLIILGAGAIGLEFAYILNAFGVKVTIVEMLDQFIPAGDSETAEVVQRAFKKKKIDVHFKTKALSYVRKEGKVELSIEKEGVKSTLTADKILVAVGRAPNTENIGLEAVGITPDRGYIKTGDYGQTSVPGIYAIGDITLSPQLAHVASKEGEIAVEHIAGHQTDPLIALDEIPYGVYCEPQMAGFGLTEKEAAAKKVEFDKAVFPYRGIGKAVAIEETDGIVKILFHKKTKEILGAHIAGYDATELVHELLLAKRSELLLEDIATMIHAHPTLSEAVMEGARMGEGWAIHV